MPQQQNLAFSVDSHLLRELGALLVGRDSTALLELIKNSYDADATTVVVEAVDLKDGTGTFTIVDDGNGMTLKTFKDAFLRIAGRSKEGTDRLSPRYRRRYTGAKGIGRLSAHKLASELEVNSIPWTKLLSDDHEDDVGVSARLQWDRVEESTADLTDTSDALTAIPVTLNHQTASGTSMQLSGIRGAWDGRRLGPFVEEIRACRPPRLLVNPLGQFVLSEPLLFSSPTVRQHGPEDPGFALELAGDLAGSDELWQALSERAHWVLEIDASADGIRYGVAPTRRTTTNAKPPVQPDWFETQRFEATHPNPSEGPFFQARILMHEGSIGSNKTDLARFERRQSGIRVFLEGFRVLPYGGPGDDWLALDQDYVRKRRDFPNEFEADLPTVQNEGYVQVGNRSYYGAVFLTEEGAPRLQSVVNREGFVPDAYFTSLADIVRSGVDLITRTRAALNRREKAAKDALDKLDLQARQNAARAKADAVRESETSSSDDPRAPHQFDDPLAPDPSSDVDEAGGDGPPTSASQRDMQALVASISTLAASVAWELSEGSDQSPVETSVEILRNDVEDLTSRLTRLSDEQVRLRTLASVGTQFGAFVHEINGLLGQAQALRSVVDEFPRPELLDRSQRRSLRSISSSADELIATLVRQASYLTDILGADSRRRRTRMPVQARVDSALKLLLPRIAERSQDVINDIDPAISSPPVFPAEMAIIVTNLVSNATKFAGNEGTIHISAHLDETMGLHLRVENTGVAVPEQDWERFFRPFESTTTDVDIVLGQGMGLGLPIVRSIAEDYNGTATFTQPTDGFATAVEVVIPDPRPGKARRRMAS